MSDDPVLAALARLEAGQETIRADILTLRADMSAMEGRMMGRINAGIDHLNVRMDNLNDHLTLGLGHSDDAIERVQSASNSSHIHGEQIRVLQKLVRGLEARITDLEKK